MLRSLACLFVVAGCTVLGSPVPETNMIDVAARAVESERQSQDKDKAMRERVRQHRDDAPRKRTDWPCPPPCEDGFMCVVARESGVCRRACTQASDCKAPEECINVDGRASACMHPAVAPYAPPQALE